MNKFIGALVIVGMFAGGAQVAFAAETPAEVQCGYGEFKVYNEQGGIKECLAGGSAEQAMAAALTPKELLGTVLFFKSGTAVQLLSGVLEKCPKHYERFQCVIEKSKVR